MTTADGPAPTYIYKLVPPDAAPPAPLPDALPVSTLDRDSGFVHLSTAHQVARTLKRFFADVPRMYVLRLPYAPIAAQIRWEDPQGTAPGPRGGEGIFPHLYNGFRVGQAEVESVETLERAEGEDWDEVLERAKGWLVY